MTLEEAAVKSAGNWRKFESFCWDRSYNLEDADQWTIAYTHNRDSGLLDEANAEAIAGEMEKFDESGDLFYERHSHWACGWIDGYAIRVYKDGQITPAFEAYYNLMKSLEDYPVLDEEDYSRREYEATLENIREQGGFVSRGYDYELPDGDWDKDVFSWFWENDQRAVENTDDRGGYPTEEQMISAFDGLGYEKLYETEELP